MGSMLVQKPLDLANLLLTKMHQRIDAPNFAGCWWRPNLTVYILFLFSVCWVQETLSVCKCCIGSGVALKFWPFQLGTAFDCFIAEFRSCAGLIVYNPVGFGRTDFLWISIFEPLDFFRGF